MRTTVELPDELFRHAKSTAALQGRKFKDLVEEGLHRVLESESRVSEPSPLYGLMKRYEGVADSGIADLGSNPGHLRDFGSDSMGNR